MRKINRFTWGRPCRTHKHNNGNGLNLRYNSLCVMCEEHPTYAGKTQEEIYTMLTTPAPEKTPEEIAALKCAASMRWNKKNIDKVRGYIKKYQSKDETRKHNATKRREWYNSLTDEEKIAVRERNYRNLLKRLGYATEEEYQQHLAEKQQKRAEARAEQFGRTEEERKERKRQKNNERYAKLTPEEKAQRYERQKNYGTPESREEKKQRQLARAREKYHALTPEEKKELFRKSNERARARKEREKDTDGSNP